MSTVPTNLATHCRFVECLSSFLFLYALDIITILGYYVTAGPARYSEAVRWQLAVVQSTVNYFSGL